MSTWISKIRGLRGFCTCAGLFPAVLALSGCLGPDPGGGATPSRDVLRSVTLYDGDVVVRGPEGYCVDRKSLRRSQTTGFVLLASCESLSGIRGNGVEPVIMTVSVLPDQAGPTAPPAAEIVQSARDTDVISQAERENMTLVHFKEGGQDILPGGDDRYWRGGMVLNGHLIGLALYAPANRPHAGAEGGKLLIELGRQLRRFSPDRPVPVAPELQDQADEAGSI